MTDLRKLLDDISEIRGYESFLVLIPDTRLRTLIHDISSNKAVNQLPALLDRIEKLEGALRVLEAEIESGWQPIETAPKDGRPFIAYSEKEPHFHPTEWHSVAPHPIIVRWLEKAYKDENGQQIGAFCDGQRARLIFNATHWKPLESTAEQLAQEFEEMKSCQVCKDDATVCGELPSLRHCPKACDGEEALEALGDIENIKGIYK